MLSPPPRPHVTSGSEKTLPASPAHPGQRVTVLQRLPQTKTQHPYKEDGITMGRAKGPWPSLHKALRAEEMTPAVIPGQRQEGLGVSYPGWATLQALTAALRWVQPGYDTCHVLSRIPGKHSSACTGRQTGCQPEQHAPSLPSALQPHRDTELAHTTHNGSSANITGREC